MSAIPPTIQQKLLEDRTLIGAGAHNGFTACMVEKAGFDFIWISSFETTASYGLPDENILPMSEFLQVARVVRFSSLLPTVADCEAGFGGPENVSYLAKSYEISGIDGICIEDQSIPKSNSLTGSDHKLVSVSEFSEKIQAAKSATRSMLIVARCEALVANLPLSEALSRSHSYVDAGADAILIQSRSTSPKEFLEFAQAWENRAPLISVPTSYNSVTVSELAEAGTKMVIYANQGIRAACTAMMDCYQTIIKSGSSREIEHIISPMGEIQSIIEK